METINKPTVWDQCLAQMDADTETIARQAREIGKLQTDILKGSIKHETEVKEKDKRIAELQLAANKAYALLSTFCDDFEKRFDNDEDEGTGDMALHYLTAAKILKDVVNRDDAGFMDRVQTRHANDLPFPRKATITEA